jgi:hypothetical protein
MPREALWRAPQDRTKVLVSLGTLGGALVLVIAFSAVFVAFAYPTERTAPSSVYVGRVDDFEVGKPVLYQERDFYVVKREDGSFVALYRMEPFRARTCQLEWRPDLVFFARSEEHHGVFYSDCARSAYNAYGSPVFGPSPGGLEQFQVVIEGNRVSVRIDGQPIIRSKCSPLLSKSC